MEVILVNVKDLLVKRRNSIHFIVLDDADLFSSNYNLDLRISDMGVTKRKKGSSPCCPTAGQFVIDSFI